MTRLSPMPPKITARIEGTIKKQSGIATIPSTIEAVAMPLLGDRWPNLAEREI